MIKNKQKYVIFILCILFSMIIFSVVWYVQNRFRSITIESFYIIYGSNILVKVLENYTPKINKWLNTYTG